MYGEMKVIIRPPVCCVKYATPAVLDLSFWVGVSAGAMKASVCQVQAYVVAQINSMPTAACFLVLLVLAVSCPLIPAVMYLLTD